jgi:long-chain fatty acid transport protein
MPSGRPLPRAAALTTLVLLVVTARTLGQQGVYVSGVGPINQSMGSAATAAPIDASGALNWNPGSIGGLGHTEMEFGLNLAYPQAQVSSSLTTAAQFPRLPPVTLTGSDSSDTGFVVLPTLGLVYQPEDSPWTYGLGVFAVAGFSANYPSDPANPALNPTPPHGIGLGAVYSSYQALQLAPTVAYRLTDHLSLGAAPTVDLANLLVDPDAFTRPNTLRGDVLPTYPSGTHSHSSWGLGFQAGLYYNDLAGWNFGLSVKSPQWFDAFRYNAVDAFGEPRSYKLHLDLPLIASFGVAYTALPRTVLAADFRYMDYGNTNGFNRAGFGADGSVQGVGWDSIFVLALGAQYQLTDTLSARLGYTYNTNPVPDSQAFFNIASPLLIEHTLSVGGSWRPADRLLLSLAYSHLFENSVQGPIVLPMVGPLAGSWIQNKAQGDFILFGTTLLF